MPKRIRFKKDNIDAFVDAFYPVGSIYMSVNNTDPGTLFGGTWVRVSQGRTIIGAGQPQQNNNTALGTLSSDQLTWNFHSETMGGEYYHQLTIQEIPSHSHRTGISPDQGFRVSDRSVNDTANVFFSQTFNDTGSTGGNGGHNNIQPYYVVYIWKRTA